MILTLIFLIVAVWRSFKTARKNGYNAINWSIAAGITFLLTQIVFGIGIEILLYYSILPVQTYSEKAFLIISFGLILSFIFVWFVVYRKIENPRDDQIMTPPSPPTFGEKM